MRLEIDRLSELLKKQCPEVVFALLHGSAKNGIIEKGSDIDVAFYIKGKANFELYQRAYDAIAAVSDEAEPDIGILNNAEPVYCFEALTGKLLFSRDMEKYVGFFSDICRAYESQIADYERQSKYRLESKNRKQEEN